MWGRTLSCSATSSSRCDAVSSTPLAPGCQPRRGSLRAAPRAARRLRAPIASLASLADLRPVCHDRQRRDFDLIPMDTGARPAYRPPYRQRRIGGRLDRVESRAQVTARDLTQKTHVRSSEATGRLDHSRYSLLAVRPIFLQYGTGMNSDELILIDV